MSNYRPENLEETQPYFPAGQSDQPAPTAPPRQGGCRWGCVLWGCLGTTVVVSVILGLMAFASYRFYINQLNKYTSESPLELPSSDVSEEEVQLVVDRLDSFRDQFDQGEAPQDLVITVDEINALISRNPDLRGRVYVTIVEGDLNADVSFPLDEIPGGTGRYFNGSARLHVELENGVLVAHVVSAEANGEPIPEMFMQGFREQNIAKELYKDVEMSRTLKRCERLTIESDRIILKVRPREEVPAESEAGVPAGETAAPTDAEPAGPGEEPPASDVGPPDDEAPSAEVEAEVETDAQTQPGSGRLE